MKAVSGLGIGLSLVFGCLLLALVAEIYYLLRWKNKKSKRIINQESEEEKEDEHNGYAKDLIQLFCFKKPQSLLQTNNGGGDDMTRNPDGNFHETQDLELGLMKHLGGDGGFEAELMKLHNQRFLFTIKEETKEDLESDDGRSRKGNDGNTPSFFSPMASPTRKSSSPLESYQHQGLNPLFESKGELEFNRLFVPSSSPPPKFKFLRDAEEKLRRRLMEEAHKIHGSGSMNSNPESLNVSEGSFLQFLNSAMNREKHNLQEQHETSSSSSSSKSLQVQILER